MKVVFVITFCCFSLFIFKKQPDRILPQDITLITLGVKDIKASEHFYSTVLGWDKTSQSSNAIVFYNLDGVQLCLYPDDLLASDAQKTRKPEGFAGVTLSHYAESPQAVDAIFESLKKLGVTITVAPSKTNWGGYRGYFTDPDGYCWEVVYNPHDNSHN